MADPAAMAYRLRAMSESSVPSTPDHGPTDDPAEVVRRFLGLLEAGDTEGATGLMADDVTYVNVSLPALRGRDRIRRVLTRALAVRGSGFEAYIHAISTDGGTTVLTERTDVLIVGPVRVQIWVCGRFDVHDGRIVLWRDYFDWGNVAAATVRGLLGAALPALRPSPPVS